MSKFRYTQLMNFVLVCTFGISLVACARGQVSTPTLAPISQPLATSTLTSRDLPDLVIINVTSDLQANLFCKSDSSNQYTFTAELTVEIANVGKAEAGPFSVDLSNTSSSQIQALGPSEKTTVNIPNVNMGDGQATVIIDAGNEVLEEDENNNTFLFAEPIPPCVTAPDFTPTPELEAEQEPEPEHKPIELYPAGQPLSIESLYMIDARHGWAIDGEAEQAQHILHTDDGGRTWIDVTPPETITIDPNGYFFNDVATSFFLDAETAWVIYSTYLNGTTDIGSLWRTQDGGRSWEPTWGLPRLTSSNISASPELEFSDARHGWLDISYFQGAGSGSHELFQTSDGGQTWEVLIHEFSDQAENWAFGALGDMDFIDPLHGWATSKHPYVAGTNIHWTDDGGRTWLRQELPEPTLCGLADVPSLTLFSPEFGMLNAHCDYGYLDPLNPPDDLDFLYVTTDGGKNWQINPLPDEQSEIEFQVPPRSMDIINSNVVYLLKEKLKEDRSEDRVADLYISRDSGRNWTNITTLGWYGDLDFADERVGWAVVRDEDENGKEKFLMLMHTTDGGRTWEQLAPQTVSGGATPRLGTLPPQIKLPDERAILEPAIAAEMQVLAELPLDKVTDMDFGSWGQLAIAQRNGRVTRWDTTGVDYPMFLHQHEDWVYDVELYSLGTASASKDGTFFLRLSDTQTSQNAHAGEITSVAFSPDEQTFATASEDQAIRIWDLGPTRYAPPAEQRTLTGHTDWVWDVTFSPDGSTLASASSDATARLWDPNSGATLHVLRGHTSTVWRVEFSPDGKLLASTSWDGTVKLWNTTTGEEVATLSGHEGPVYGIAFSPNGKLLASGSADGTVMVWDFAQTKLLTTLHGHTGPVRSIAFNPEGDILASASDDGTVKFWGVVP
jgi:photosystem II stability/assembly factor-like uncharacterized protein